MRAPQERAGALAVLVWLLLFPQQVLLGSSTLFSGAALAGLLATACVAAWLAVALRRADALADARLALACGIASCMAGIALACSPGGAFSQAMFAVDVLGALGVLFGWMRAAGARGGDAATDGKPAADGQAGGEAGPAGNDASLLSGAALMAAGAVYAVVRLFAGVLGSFGNMGVFSAVGLFVLAFLPLVSALSLRGARPTSVGAPAERPPAGAASVRGASAWQPFCLLGGIAALTVFVMLFFCGFATAPFQVNMLFCLDCVAAGLLAYGAVLCFLSRVVRANPVVFLGASAAVPLIVALGSLLLFAFGGDGRDPVALSMLFWSCTALVLCGFFVAGAMARGFMARVAACAFLAEAAVGMRLFGVAFKQGVGIDAPTMTMTVLVAFAVLVAAFLVAAVATAWLAQRAMERAEEADAAEPADSLQGQVVVDAMRQARLDVLQGYDLTKREVEMALRLLEGNTMDSIAKSEGVTINTVRYHARNIYRKTGAQGKQQFLDLVGDLIARSGNGARKTLLEKPQVRASRHKR